MKEVAAPAAVAVNPIAGLAQTFRYGFRLPADRIAATQEANAAQCEALGPQSCRVAGMGYDVGRGHAVSASLDLLVVPDAARKLAAQATQAVVDRHGMLAHAQIESQAAGRTIAEAGAQAASRSDERQRIEASLARTDLKPQERTQLQQRLQELADADRTVGSGAREAAFAMAATPVRFDYESGPVDTALSDGPMLGAVKDGWANVAAFAAVMLMLGITLAPWAVLAAPAVFAIRRARLWLAPVPA